MTILEPQSNETREHIHRIFVAGVDRYPVVSAERADNLRREIYRERARLNRDDPHSRICKLANGLTFRLSGAMLIVDQKRKPQIVRDLASATGTIQ